MNIFSRANEHTYHPQEMAQIKQRFLSLYPDINPHQPILPLNREIVAISLCLEGFSYGQIAGIPEFTYGFLLCGFLAAYVMINQPLRALRRIAVARFPEVAWAEHTKQYRLMRIFTLLALVATPMLWLGLYPTIAELGEWADLMVPTAVMVTFGGFAFLLRHQLRRYFNITADSQPLLRQSLVAADTDTPSHPGTAHYQTPTGQDS